MYLVWRHSVNVVFTRIYAYIDVCISVGGTVCMWCLGDKFLQLALSFRHMNSEDQTRSYQA